MNAGLYFYYYIKPFIPRPLQIILRRPIVKRKRALNTHNWPIDEKAKKPPDGWSGWPGGKRFALVLSHDVDSKKGLRNCLKLMEIEQSLGFRSSFNFVPERYEVLPELRHRLNQNGFEIGVHGLRHDGKLFMSRKLFEKRAVRINQYLREWNCSGFYSPSMHRNFEWMHDLNMEFASSTFDTDPFEPDSDGVRTIFPFRVKGNRDTEGFVELPYTLPQDFTLFVLMKEKDIAIWKKKLDWIAENGGMALLNTHPDYMDFDNDKRVLERYPARFYIDFLERIKNKYQSKYWHVLPKQIARFCRQLWRCTSNGRFQDYT